MGLPAKVIKQLNSYVPNWYKLQLGTILSKAFADQVAVYTGTTVGGATSEAMTFTGLAAADTILSVDRKSGGTAVSPNGWSAQAANALTVNFSADPGAGCIVVVSVSKAANPDT